MGHFIGIHDVKGNSYILNKKNIALVEENDKGGITLTVVIAGIANYYHILHTLKKFNHALNDEI